MVGIPPKILPLPSHLSQLGHLTATDSVDCVLSSEMLLVVDSSSLESSDM
jgi:hypothetical protein